MRGYGTPLSNVPPGQHTPVSGTPCVSHDGHRPSTRYLSILPSLPISARRTSVPNSLHAQCPAPPPLPNWHPPGQGPTPLGLRRPSPAPNLPLPTQRDPPRSEKNATFPSETCPPAASSAVALRRWAPPQAISETRARSRTASPVSHTQESGEEPYT